MKKTLLTLTIILTSSICLADDTYRHVEYLGDFNTGCYEKLCNSHNCYTKKVSCFTQSYMEDAIKQGLSTTFAISHGRPPTKKELDALYYAYMNRGKLTPAKSTQKPTAKSKPQQTTAQRQAQAKAKAAEQKRIAEEKKRQEEYEKTRPNVGFSFPFALNEIMTPLQVKSFYLISTLPHKKFDEYPLNEYEYFAFNDINSKGRIINRYTTTFMLTENRKANEDDIKFFKDVEQHYKIITAQEWRIAQANLLRRQYKLEEKFKNKTVKDMLTPEDLKVMNAMELPEGKNINQVLNLKMGCFVDMKTMTTVDITKVGRETYINGSILQVDKNFIKGIQRFNLERM